MGDIYCVTATEIIEQIKQLPPQEKGRVAEFVRAEAVRFAKDEEARRALFPSNYPMAATWSAGFT